MVKKGCSPGKYLYVILITMIVGILVWLAACASSTQQVPTSSSSPTSSPSEESNDTIPGAIRVTAENLAFDKSEIRAYAGSSVTIEFTNKDSTPHNVAFYTDEGATEAIFVGEVITGPQTVTYEFTAPFKPGIYFFRCDVHPNMNGDFFVAGTGS